MNFKLKNFFATLLLFTELMSCDTSKKIHFNNAENKKEAISQKFKDSSKKIVMQTGKPKTDSFLIKLLEQFPQQFDSILRDSKKRNVQIIYTEVNRDKNNAPHFIDHYFNVDSTKYFYPASTVKLPVAILALQKLNELNNAGVTKNTTMVTEATYSGQQVTYNDPQSEDGRPTIANYIKRIFLTSDNEAFNRLYEFLGQNYINDQLHKKGYSDVQILHRLDIFLSEDENRHTNPVQFLDSNKNVIYNQPMVFNKTTYAQRNDSLGDAYYSGGKLINGPMNFSKKNRISLEDLHKILRSVIFPGSISATQKFNLTESDYLFIQKYLSQFPSETNFPAYDSANYPDAYVKFLLYGSRKESLPKNIRIFNKVGDAYGQLIDVAYIIDFDKNIEFFLSAAINCNSNGILNDDTYDYDSIGFPFMKNLGQSIYNYELHRKRKYKPGLSSFKIAYDK